MVLKEEEVTAVKDFLSGKPPSGFDKSLAEYHGASQLTMLNLTTIGSFGL